MSPVADLSKYLQGDWINFDYLKEHGPQQRMIVGIEEQSTAFEGKGAMPELVFDETGFEDEPNRHTLNKTNLRFLISKLGTDPRSYIGKEVVLQPFVDPSKKGNFRNQVQISLAPPKGQQQLQDQSGVARQQGATETQTVDASDVQEMSREELEAALAAKDQQQQGGGEPDF